MVLTQIDIDEGTLAEAMRASGTKTREETVNLALWELARNHRLAALEHFATLAAGWDYEGWMRLRQADKDAARDQGSDRLLGAADT